LVRAILLFKPIYERIYVVAHNPGDSGQLVLLAHELIHSRQCKQFVGAGKFGYQYFKEFGGSVTKIINWKERLMILRDICRWLLISSNNQAARAR